MKAAETLVTDVEFATGPYEAASGASALVIVTEWNAFRSLDFDQLKSTMEAPILVDLRNIYRRDEVEATGFSYWCIGRPATLADDYVAEAAE
jgi:UDPglucose 6-dehydrogenase